MMINTIVSGNNGYISGPDINGAVAAGSINNAVGSATAVTGITNGTNGNQVGTAVTLSAPDNSGGKFTTSTMAHCCPPAVSRLRMGERSPRLRTAIAATGNTIALTNGKVNTATRRWPPRSSPSVPNRCS